MLKFFILSFLLLCSVHTWSEEARALEKGHDEKIKILRNLKRNMDWLKSELGKKEFLIQQGIDNSPKLAKNVEDLKHRLEETQKNFLVTSSGVNYELFAPAQQIQEKRDLLKEVQEVIAPLIDSFRRISARPRKIEGLKNKLEYLNEQYTQGTQTQSTLSKMQQDQSGEFTAEVLELIDLVESKQNELRIEIDTIQGQLNNELKDNISFLDVAGQSWRTFLQTKSKNLGLGLFVFILIFLGANLIRGKIIIPHFSQRSNFTFFKTFDALYELLSTLFAFAATILTFYLLNDWFLVTISILFLTAVIWSFKNLAPQFFQELRLVLNLGPVKEGERVIWGGVPWKVQKLGLYSTLINPELQGGLVRLSSAEMIKLISRPGSPEETWFPSRVGDWVKLSDGFNGTVIHQSPEQVILKNLAETKKSYQVDEYLKLAPQNFSQGFKLIQNMDLDFTLLKNITQTIPNKIQRYLEEKLRQVYGQSLISLEVEFSTCTESTLQLMIISQWPGELARKQADLNRQINKLLVDICVVENWSIPFPQLTVHLPQK